MLSVFHFAIDVSISFKEKEIKCQCTRNFRLGMFSIKRHVLTNYMTLNKHESSKMLSVL